MIRLIRRNLAVTLSLAMAVSLPCTAFAGEPDAVQAPLLFSSGFESGTLVNGEGWNISGNAPTITTKYAREGKYAIESYLNRETSPVSYRTEVRARAPDPKLGQEYWYGFSVYIPAPFTADNIWELIGQWHATPDANEPGLNPPLSIEISNGNWRIISRYSTEQPTSDANKRTAFDKVFSPVEVGQWVDWVVNVKWSATAGQGFLKIWKNGTQIVDLTGPNTYNDAVGPYFKMGVYKGWKDRVSPTGNVSVRTFYHDSFRMGGATASYADVSPATTAKPNPPEDVTVE